jgi:hypothetical protein
MLCLLDLRLLLNVTYVGFEALKEVEYRIMELLRSVV